MWYREISFCSRTIKMTEKNCVRKTQILKFYSWWYVTIQYEFERPEHFREYICLCLQVQRRDRDLTVFGPLERTSFWHGTNN